MKRQARRFPGSALISASAVGHCTGNHTDPGALSADYWNTWERVNHST